MSDVVDELVDMVNHPPHYKDGGIETIDFIRAKLGDAGFVAFCRGNALKYLSRLGKKGDPAEDARKAEWYTARAAEVIEGGAEDAGQLDGHIETLERHAGYLVQVRGTRYDSGLVQAVLAGIAALRTIGERSTPSDSRSNDP